MIALGKLYSCLTSAGVFLDLAGPRSGNGLVVKTKQLVP